VKRRITLLLTATVGVVLAAWPSAQAKYRGNDVLGYLAPESLLGTDSLVNRLPVGRVLAGLTTSTSGWFALGGSF